MAKIIRSCSTALVAVLALAGCGGSGTDTHAGDSLRIASILAPTTFDPHLARSTAMEPYLTAVYDRLLRFDEAEGADPLQPMVAKEWSYSPDMRSITFELRDDVKFHDGTPVNSAAVKASIERAKEMPGSTVTEVFSFVSGIEAPDDDTVIVELAEPRADAASVFASYPASIINPAYMDRDLNQTAAGSGPYQLVSVSPNDRAAYEKHPDYWDEDVSAFNKLEILGIADDNARLNAQRSGQVDASMVRLAELPEAQSLVEQGGTELSEIGRPTWWSMSLNNTQGPLSNPDVRRAMNYAIDRDAINKGLLNEGCEPTSQPIQSGTEGHVDDPSVGYDYDVEKAQQLLSDAGYADGFRLNAVTGGSLTPVTPALQEQLARVGIDLAVQAADLNDALAQWVGGTADTFIFSHNTSTDPVITLRDNFMTSRFQGELPDAVSSDLDQIMTQQRSRDERKALLEDVSRKISNEALQVFICAPPTLYLHAETIGGFDTMNVPAHGGPFDVRDLYPRP